MKMLVILAAATIGFATHADHVAAPAWVCELHGNLDGHSVSLGLSVTKVTGSGTVACQSLNGVRREIPVSFRLSGIGVGLGYTDYSEVGVVSANIGIATPEGMIGTYSVGPSAGLTLIEAGLDVGAALKVSREGGLAFELGLTGRRAHGLEGKVQLQAFEVLPAGGDDDGTDPDDDFKGDDRGDDVQAP